MILYFILLLITAAIGYTMGSLNTMVLASNFVFHYNLDRLGTGNDWLSNFRRVYGWRGAAVLLLVEAIKDVIPLFAGGVLLGLRGYPDVGRAFAGFCVVMGRLWPVFYELKGTRAVMPLIFAGLFAAPSLGVALAIVFVGSVFVFRYLPIAVVAEAVALIGASLLVVDRKLTAYLLMFAGLAVIVRQIPLLKQISRGEVEKFSLREDLSYKFDEKFK